MGNQRDHKHTNIAVTSTCLSCGEQLGEGHFDTRQLAKQDVDKESATALPERDAMSLVDGGIRLVPIATIAPEPQVNPDLNATAVDPQPQPPASD